MSDKPRKYMPKWLRRTFIFGPIVLIVAGTAYGMYVYYTSMTSTTGSGDTTQTDKGQESYYSKARAALLSDGPEASQKILDDQIAVTTDPVDQSALYASKASIASSSEAGSDVESAIGYALKAYELDPVFENASFVAEMYRQAGNNAKAIEYYKLAMEKIGDYDTAGLQTQSSYEYFKAMIAELSS